MRYRKYLDVLEPELQADQSLKILDIGCALCDFTARAWGLNKNNQFSCVDISENAIAWGSNNYPQFTFKVGTLPIIPFNEEFDMIFCLQVLCYLDANGRKEAIENMRNLLGPSGKVVFSGMIGDKDYHTEEEVVELFEQDFDMRHVSFNFWKLHQRVIEYPLSKVHSFICRLLELLGMSDGEFQDRILVSTTGGATFKILKVLRLASPVTIWMVRILDKPIRLFRGSRLLAVLFSKIQKILNGSRNPDEILVIVAKK